MKKKIFFLCCVSLFLVSLIFSTYPVRVIQVFIFDKGADYQKILYQERVNNESFFSIHWIHSVSRRPIIETYKIEDNNEISLFEMIFDSFSPNLPSSPEYHTKWEYFENYIKVTGYDLVFTEVPVVIGQVIADHTLYFKDQIIPLKDLYKPGGYVKIKVVQMSLFSYWLSNFQP